MAIRTKLPGNISLEDVYSPLSKGELTDTDSHLLDGGIQIYLATHRGLREIAPIRVLSSDTIKTVKMRISRLDQGFYTKWQRLVSGGRELAKEDENLQDYGIKQGQAIHLLLKLSDIIDVAVETQSGQSYLFSVERSHRVRDLKQKIVEEEGLEEHQLVLWGGRTGAPDDHHLIDDLVVDGETMVHLVALRSTKVRVKQVGKNLELSVNASDMIQRVDGNVLRNIPFNVQYDTPVKGTGTLFPVTDAMKYSKRKGELSTLLREASAGLQAGKRPVLSREGLGGVYFLQNDLGSKSVAVFKPIDEEPMAMYNPKGVPLSQTGEGLRKGTRVGEGAFREVAAYLLDHEGFAGVPPTLLVECAHSSFRYPNSMVAGHEKPKLGSLQKFVKSMGNCEDFGPAHFHPQEVHKIAVLDMRLANTDRNGENILVCAPQGQNKWGTLIPIDHGYSIPEKFEDCTFEWLCWPQSRLPFNAETKAYIERLDVEKDITLLIEAGWHPKPECLRVLRVSMLLLKVGVAKGLTAHAIGSMMCRTRLTEKSVVEMLIEKAEEDMRSQQSVCEIKFLSTLKGLVQGFMDGLS